MFFWLGDAALHFLGRCNPTHGLAQVEIRRTGTETETSPQIYRERADVIDANQTLRNFPLRDYQEICLERSVLKIARRALDFLALNRWLSTLTPMREDPAKDRETGSWQDWEIEHVVDKLCRDFPKKPRSAIESVIKGCKETIQPSSGRERLIDCARRSLSLEA